MRKLTEVASIGAPAGKARSCQKKSLPNRRTADPLAAIMALSDDERLALFT